MRGQEPDGWSFITLWDTRLPANGVLWNGTYISDGRIDDKTLYIPVIGKNLYVWYRKQGESVWYLFLEGVGGHKHTTEKGKALKLILPEPGKYYVKIKSKETIGFLMGENYGKPNLYGSSNRLLAVRSWGKNEWKAGLSGAFFHCKNLTSVSEIDTYIADAVLTPQHIEGSLSGMFLDCTSFNGDLSGWDVSQVTDMSRMFFGCTSFNRDLSNWDVSQVTDMGGMFLCCTSFNGDLSKWDVSKVVGMSGMFSRCTAFNGDLSKWNVGQVTGMSGMFSDCSSFNGDLSKWNVGQVTEMSYMFAYCKAFNGDLSKWKVGQVTEMDHLFYGCTSFNGDLSGWDVRQVTDMTDMFSGCNDFDHNISQWKPLALRKARNFSNRLSTRAWTAILESWGDIATALSSYTEISVNSKHYKSANNALTKLHMRNWTIEDGGEEEGASITITVMTSGRLEVREDGIPLISGANLVAYGAKLSITAVPAEGYHLKSINANGNPISIASPATFVVTSDVVLSAEFEKGDTPDPVEVLAEVALAPNPFISTLTISHAERVSHYCVLNAAGVAVAEGVNDGAEQLAIDGSQWPSGLYHIVLTGVAGSRTLRAVKR